MGGWADGLMGGWADGRMGGWADGRMGGWEDGRMGGILKQKSPTCEKVGDFCFNLDAR